MGTPHIQIPLDALHDVGEALEKISESGKLIISLEPQFALLGADHVSGATMVNAVWEFETTWNGSRETILENTNLLGEVSKKIADTARDLDEIKASGMLELAGAMEGKQGCFASTSKASIYAFNEQTASKSEFGILTTMDRLHKIIESIGKSVEALKPFWIATEADQYYEMMAKFKTAAIEVTTILNSVEAALESVRVDTSNFRNGVRDALNNTE